MIVYSVTQNGGPLGLSSCYSKQSLRFHCSNCCGFKCSVTRSASAYKRNAAHSGKMDCIILVVPLCFNNT
jgi:hypothetical protein